MKKIQGQDILKEAFEEVVQLAMAKTPRAPPQKHCVTRFKTPKNPMVLWSQSTKSGPIGF